MSLHVLLRHQFTTVRMDLEFEVPTPGVTILFGAVRLRQIDDHQCGCRSVAAG